MMNVLIMLIATYITVSLITIICFAVLFFRVSKRMRQHRKSILTDSESIQKEIDRSLHETADRINDNEHFGFSSIDKFK